MDNKNQQEVTEKITKKNSKPGKEKRYKQTQELWGELMSWIIMISSISLLLMSSFGANLSEGKEKIKVLSFVIPSLMFIFSLFNAWLNKKAYLSNTNIWFRILRFMGITALLTSFGYGIFLLTTNAMAKELYNISWFVINLIFLSVITAIAYITITSSVKIEKIPSQKIHTEEITKEKLITFEEEPLKKKIKLNEDNKEMDQSEAIKAAVEAYRSIRK